MTKILTGAVAVLILSTATAFAAASTTCLCRSEDGKSFVESTHRHGRWACDVKLGYVANPDGKQDVVRRSDKQTCSAEEITQYKVWACMERGCTYSFATSTQGKNKGLERIELLKGERRP